jgi:hypothetical protein
MCGESEMATLQKRYMDLVVGSQRWPPQQGQTKTIRASKGREKIVRNNREMCRNTTRITLLPPLRCPNHNPPSPGGVPSTSHPLLPVLLLRPLVTIGHALVHNLHIVQGIGVPCHGASDQQSSLLTIPSPHQG